MMFWRISVLSILTGKPEIAEQLLFVIALPCTVILHVKSTPILKEHTMTGISLAEDEDLLPILHSLMQDGED